MQPAEQAAAAFCNDHLPDGLPGGYKTRLAVMEALAALIAAEREAVREACVEAVVRCMASADPSHWTLAHAGAALRALPLE